MLLCSANDADMALKNSTTDHIMSHTSSSGQSSFGWDGSVSMVGLPSVQTCAQQWLVSSPIWRHRLPGLHGFWWTTVWRGSGRLLVGVLGRFVVSSQSLRGPD